MKIIHTPLAVLRFQYGIVRLPLQMIEERVVAPWARKRLRDCLRALIGIVGRSRGQRTGRLAASKAWRRARRT